MKATKTILKGEDVLGIILFVISFIFVAFTFYKCTVLMEAEAARSDYKPVYSTTKTIVLPMISSNPTKRLEVKTLVDDRTPQQKAVSRCKRYSKQVGEEFDLDPDLIMAVIEVESRYTEDILGNGTVGLMQLVPSCHSITMKEYGYSVEDLKDPYKNIRVGSKYLSTLVHKYDDISFALVCYNKGEGGALSSGLRTSHYSEKVMKVYNRIKGGDIYGQS